MVVVVLAKLKKDGSAISKIHARIKVNVRSNIAIKKKESVETVLWKKTSHVMMDYLLKMEMDVM